MNNSELDQGRRWRLTDDAITRLTFMAEELAAYQFLFEQLDEEKGLRGFNVTLRRMRRRVEGVKALLKRVQMARY